jgi:hypothetical protein
LLYIKTSLRKVLLLLEWPLELQHLISEWKRSLDRYVLVVVVVLLLLLVVVVVVVLLLWLLLLVIMISSSSTSGSCIVVIIIIIIIIMIIVIVIITDLLKWHMYVTYVWPTYYLFYLMFIWCLSPYL